MTMKKTTIKVLPLSERFPSELMRSYSRSKRRWQWAGYKVISNNLQWYLEHSEESDFDEASTSHILRRLAINLFYSGEYAEAWPRLEKVCSEERSYWIPTEIISNCNISAARCSSEMYFITRDNTYLKYAYHYYQMGIETMKFDLYAMFRLPQVLEEYGRVMEHYGAFQAAMETYTKILNNFPNYRGYFHVLYRTTIVGKYISEYSDQVKANEFSGQCIDTLQFLLEALPKGIDDVHAVLWYARLLETSSDPANRFRAMGVFQALYNVCKKHNNIADTDKFADFKDWVENPMVWRRLGDRALVEQEELVARECYAVYVEKVNMFRKKKDLEAMNIEVLMKIARNCASIQNNDDAARYAQMALKQNHFDKEVRTSLCKWSPEHAKRIQQEEHSVFVIESAWRHRWFAPGYKKRYHLMVVEELEEKLKKNYFNIRTRTELGYFARTKWRPRFVFENDCAKKIQRQFRHVRIIWQWQAPQRVRYSAMSTEAYRQFLKTPFKRQVREDVYRLGTHRYVSRKHAIKKILPVLEKQDRARDCIWKGFKAFKLRLDIDRLIAERKRRYMSQLYLSATLIQSIIRMRPAQMLARQKLKQRDRELKAVVTIQQYIRARNNTFQHSVTRMLDRAKREKERIALFIHFAMLFRWKKKLAKKAQRARETVAASLIQRSYRRWQLSREVNIRRDKMALRIQNMFHSHKLNGLTGVTRKVMKERKTVGFSQEGDSLLHNLVESDNGSMSGAGCFYKCPGVRQSGENFQRALNQHTIYCTRQFSPDDCVMLGAVLRHPMCRTRRLIFHSVKGTSTNFDFDMIQAIRQCRSLRTVAVFGGVWHIGFIQSLMKQVQTENPMIQSVYIEGIVGVKKEETHLLTLSTTNLFMDFFNYSVPGIQHVSLHGLGLLSQDVKELARGLVVNTSLQTLCLSLNMIEEDGFVELFNAITSNKRSNISLLDVSWNLISMGDEIIRMFDNFSGPNLPGKSLSINLCHNRIDTEYIPIREYRTDLIVLTVRQEIPETLMESRSAKKSSKKFGATYNTKPSGYRQLQKRMDAYPSPLKNGVMSTTM